MEALEDNLASGSSKVSRNTQPFNYTGHPALAMPVGKSSAGLPASMQLIGRFFDDPLVLRVAYAYQHSVDWDALTAVAP
jgi:Asp-tRNA(Asn)/Glu-tRNA(Gln) amidotransferase A subunit family amidase